MADKIRIQKYVSEQGIMSRRKTEAAIQNGWVFLNGQVVTELGTKMDPDVDVITFADEVHQQKAATIILAFHKPRGIVTNCPQGNEQEIKDLLPTEYKHLNAIGRLDKDSEGLILLTDDGTLTTQLLQTDPPHERVYLVTVSKALTDDMLYDLENGVQLGDYLTQPTTIHLKDRHHFAMTLTEGKNRQIRRMMQKVGTGVVKLKRIRFASISLDQLKPGQFITVQREELF